MPTSKPSLFQQIYQALESRGKLRTQGKGFRTNWPNTEHQDRNPSFFLFQSGAGRCYSQCDQYWKPLELAQLLGIAATTGEVGLTVQQLAEAKRLPEDFLRAHGVTDGVSGNKRSPCVDIPYLDESAGVTGMRKRVSLFGNPQFLWRRGDKPSLYGLEDLGVARMLGYAVLVEGESDRWTLKYAGFPAFGVPGVSTWQESWASHLSGLRTYLWNEPDATADSLPGKVSQDLPDLLVITPPQSIKDPSELFQYDPGSFKDQFQALMAAARLASELLRVKQDAEHKELYEKCKPLLTDPALLHKAILVAEGLGLVGERRNAGIIHLAMRSRATKRPNNLEINSPSSSGKTFTVLTVLALESPEAFYELTAGSERALIFNGESLRHRMIYFQEPEGLAEGVGAAVIKSLIWEGRLRYDTVIKDASGKFVGQHIEKDGPTGLIITTTIPLEEQFTNRLFRIEVNDSEEQTRLILEAIADSVNGYRTQLTCRSGMLFRNSWVNRKR